MSEVETAQALAGLISQPAAAVALLSIALQLRALRSEAPAWVVRVESATERVVRALTREAIE